ncbi:hypothetical protein [Timonella senegalensis]|uniref:hypothetical protein n=1 Tax=Timonella senegalensis TaxID=1465825 RepID=UPI002FDCF488
MEIGSLIQLISALGIGAILTKLFEGIFQWATGRSKREHDAWQQRDTEAKKRRQLEEYCHQLRHDLIDLGLDADDLPPWPTYSNQN